MTAPDGDRLPATNSGQETPSRPDGSPITPDDIEWCSGCGQKHSKCECPAPQQPPAQEREEEFQIGEGNGPSTMARLDKRVLIARWLRKEYGDLVGVASETWWGQEADDLLSTLNPAPPSEADSAGEVERLRRRVARWGVWLPITAQAEFTADLAALAASPGAQGGDEGAATVLAALPGRMLDWWSHRDAVGLSTNTNEAHAWLTHQAALVASPGVQGGDGEARERLAAVLALHPGGGNYCMTCVLPGGYGREPWPCPTVRAAGGGR